MRIATAYSYASNVSNLQKKQEQLESVQEQMTSGLRISKPSDDPAGISRAERAKVEVSKGKQLLRTVEASRAMMTQGEGALGNAVDLVQSAREALVAAGNGSYSASERSTLAEQLKQLRGQLLSVANQQDGSGHYLFGGQGATTPPFVDGAGTDPDGDGINGVGWWDASAAGFGDGQISGSLEENLPLTIDGRQAWLGASGGANVFDALDKAISVLSNPAATGATVSAAVQTGIGELDASMGQLQWARSVAGETLNALDGVDGRTQDRILNAESARSSAEDMDMIEAVSEFSNRQTSYQAALQSYSMVQKLSLFNYIGN